MFRVHLFPFFPSEMSAPPQKRRRTRAIGPDSAELAKAFTHKTITTTNRSGELIKKDVLVPLVAIRPIPNNAVASSSNEQYYDTNMDVLDSDEHNNNRSKSKVSKVLNY